MNVSTLFQYTASQVRQETPQDALNTTVPAASFLYYFLCPNVNISLDTMSYAEKLFGDISEINSLRPKRTDSFLSSVLYLMPTSIKNDHTDLCLVYPAYLAQFYFTTHPSLKKDFAELISQICKANSQRYEWVRQEDKMMEEFESTIRDLGVLSPRGPRVSKLAYDIQRLHLLVNNHKTTDSELAFRDYNYSLPTERKIVFPEFLRIRRMMATKALRQVREDGFFKIATDCDSKVLFTLQAIESETKARLNTLGGAGVSDK